MKGVRTLKRFCTVCGHELADGVHFCKNCGTKVHELSKEKSDAQQSESIGETSDEKKSSAKQPVRNTGKNRVSKKQKWIIGTSGIIAVCLIVFFLWGNAHYSPERTTERFADGLLEGDLDEIQDIVVVEGEQISAGEAEALSKFSENTERFTYEEGDDPQTVFEDLPVFDVEASDQNALLFFTDYEVAAEPQYVRILSEIEGVETVFNETEFPVSESETRYTEYGPMAPGVYEASSIYETSFGAVDSTSEIELMNGANEYHSDLEVSGTTLHLSNEYDLPYESIELKLNEERLETDIEDETVDAGHIIVDGSVELTGTVETAWGSVDIEPVPITDAEQDIEINLMNDELQETLSDVVLDFSEDYVRALAEQDAGEIGGVSDRLQEEFNSEWFSDNDEVGFSGHLEEVGISFEDLSEVDSSQVYELPVQLSMSGQFDEEDEDQLHQNDAVIQLSFEENDNEWTVHDFDADTLSGDYDYEFFEGSKERVEGVENEENFDSEEDDVQESDITELVEGYVYDLADAVNEGDYSLVSDSIASGSELDAMQSDLVDRQHSSNLTQNIESVDVENVSEVSGDEWEVETSEVIELQYSSGDTDVETYNWTYTVERIDGDYQISSLE